MDLHTENRKRSPKTGVLRMIGNAVITGAADDDPSAIGTYASAGAKYGLSFLWIAPLVLPMMFVVVYLSAKIGRLYGKGLFAAIYDRYPKYLLYPAMLGALVGNVIEAAADLGGIGSALNLFIPLPISLLVVCVAVAILLFQIHASYQFLRNIFKWLTLALLAYVAAGLAARPDLLEVIRSTFCPAVHFTADYLAMIVACIGTSLSAYIYTWQSNQEVEEQIAKGRHDVDSRRRAGGKGLERTSREVMSGMLFSNLILYFIIMATGATLHASGHTNIDSAVQAASALQPAAGPAAKVLFALGLIGVGFLAVPVMTAGAAYDVAQSIGRPSSLNAKPQQAKVFYAAMGLTTGAAVALNFLGVNPMRALVLSGIVQGISVPPLLLIMMLLTNDRRVVGTRANSLLVNALGWATTAVTFAASALLIGRWLHEVQAR